MGQKVNPLGYRLGITVSTRLLPMRADPNIRSKVCPPGPASVEANGAPRFSKERQRK